MELFIYFVLTTFVASIFLKDRSRSLRRLVLLGLCLFMAFAYFFLRQI